MAGWLVLMSILALFYALLTVMIQLRDAASIILVFSRIPLEGVFYIYFMSKILLGLMVFFVLFISLRSRAFRSELQPLIWLLILFYAFEFILDKVTSPNDWLILYPLVKIGVVLFVLGLSTYVIRIPFREIPSPGASRSVGLTSVILSWLIIAIFVVQLLFSGWQDLIIDDRIMPVYLDSWLGIAGFVCFLLLWSKTLKIPMQKFALFSFRISGALFALKVAFDMRQFAMHEVVDINLIYTALDLMLFASLVMTAHETRYGVLNADISVDSAESQAE